MPDAAIPIRYMFSEADEPAVSRNSTLRGHCALVRESVAVAGAPPAAWTELLDQIGEIQQAAQTRGAFTDAIIEKARGGHDARGYRELVVMGVADKSVNLAAFVVEDALNILSDDLRGIIRQVAKSRYAVAAKKFDAAAKRFTDLASRIDLDLDPGAAIVLHPKSVAAYRQGPDVARELDTLLIGLSACAELARPDGAPVAGTHDAWRFGLPLTVDNLADLSRRQVWLAWTGQRRNRPPAAGLTHEAMTTAEYVDNPLRCGRWQALLKIGAQLRAYPAVASMPLSEPLRHPFTRFTDDNGQRLRAPEVIDPEAAPPPGNMLKKLVGVVTGHSDVVEGVADYVAED